MHQVKVNNQRCSLCNSNNTNCKAVFNGTKYIMRVDCKNKDCISNNLYKRHPFISSGNQIK